MKPTKTKATTRSKRARLFGLSGIEGETGIDRHTIRKVLAGVKPDGDIRGHPAWTLDTFRAAADKWEQANKAKGGGPLKDQKIAEEIRKLRLANDAKAGLLIPRSDVTAAFQRISARVIQARTESESRDPVRLVGKDLADMRDGVRAIWDNIGRALSECASEWEGKPNG